MDDDAALLDIVSRTLEDHFEVVITQDPMQAHELVLTCSFDVFLYDVCMERLPGIELLMLTLAAAQDTPVLLMTGAPTVERAVEALRAGAADLLLKPLDFQTLPATLLEVIERFRRTTIPRHRIESVHDALSRAVEAKDPTTSGHGDRVREVCRMIAQEFDLDRQDQETLDQAAALHDIGKIGVPDAVLSKPGKLSEEEFALIQLHPEVGARILEPLPEMEAVRECVLNHHERWDGTGYPRGLHGDEVSLPGRVLILVEVFDALAHRRSYKDAWPKVQIRDHFASLAGRHFDPELTGCFLGLVDRRFDVLVNPFAEGRSAHA